MHLEVSMKRSILLLALLGSVLVARASTTQAVAHAAAKPAFPVTIIDDHGNKVKITHQPKRIVSLDPRDTETLFALDLENRVVGDGGKDVEGATGIVNAAGKPRDFKYPSEWPSKWGRDYPIRSLAVTHIEGGCCGVDFNLETIESLSPDLILAPFSTTEEPVFQKMRDLGLKVIILDPANFRGILHDITLIGRATGVEAQARAVAATMQSEVNGVKKALAKVKSRPRVYYEIDATNPTQPYTVGPGTFIDEAIHVAGGKNIADGVTSCAGTTCYPQLSLEAIVVQDPQVILFSIYERLYSNVTADSVKSRSGWGTISAVRTGRISEFNDDVITRAGPRTGIGIEQLARVIHPEVFRKHAG
jgi:iron complex transport system substrate-binding protein